MRSSQDVYKRLVGTLVSALVGQTPLVLTLVVYSALALVLLGYVSAQVYTSVLAQEIAELKRETLHEKENLSRLAGTYVSLTSRERVSEYCEAKLGMVEAKEDRIERVAMRGIDFGSFDEPEALKIQSAPFSAYVMLRDRATRPNQ